MLTARFDFRRLNIFWPVGKKTRHLNIGNETSNAMSAGLHVNASFIHVRCRLRLHHLSCQPGTEIKTFGMLSVFLWVTPGGNFHVCMNDTVKRSSATFNISWKVLHKQWSDLINLWSLITQCRERWTLELFLVVYCVARKKPIRSKMKKPKAVIRTVNNYGSVRQLLTNLQGRYILDISL